VLNDPEKAWQVWSLIEATDWRFLPRAGGLLDQPEALLEDVLTIAALARKIERMLEQQSG
jgi:hypothetical protein